ncbi:preprotein translocase subunit SecG [Candidatus Woesebacteria bacterium]|nr:preprotein translocase subunit SecG [Candidatus Woesebacteria bacterium]
MHTTLMIVQIVLSISIIACILLQAQGTGLGAAWGGGGETFHTRRGIEKIVFITGIVCGILFTINSIALLMLS